MQQPTKEQIEHLEPFANKISKIRNYIPLAKAAEAKLKEDKRKFFEAFQGHLGKYAVEGVLCLLVLLFDFWVSSETLKQLALTLHINVSLIAIIFSILDGGVAILASGGFATNTIQRIKSQKMWRPILWGLAMIKIMLFIIMTFNTKLVNSSGITVSERGSLEVILHFLPQTIFIIFVYAVLHYAGFGLWYIVGRCIHSAKEFLSTKSEELQQKEIQLIKKFESEILKIGADSLSVNNYFFNS